jgi:uncharacterized protein (TIGR03437 family)
MTRRAFAVVLPIAASALFIASAFAGAVSVNGTCETGNCTTPDTLASGGTVNAPFSVIFTLPNTDQFYIAGTINASDTGGTGWSLTGGRTTITYLGNTSGTASRADTLTVDVLQNVANSLKSATAGELVYGAFGTGFGTGSNATSTVLVNGTSLGVLGPFSPTPSPLFSKILSGVAISGLGNPVLLDERLTASFAAGSSAGAFVIFSDAPVSLPLGAAISVNGTCQIGNCTTPDTVDSNGSLSTPFNFIHTLANGDRFQIQGGYTGSDTNGSAFNVTSIQVTATYLGNSSGGTSGADALTIDSSQNFEYTAGGGGQAHEAAAGTFGGAIAQTGTSAMFQLLINGTALPQLGPFLPSGGAFSSPQTNFNILSFGNPVLVDYRAALTFGAGSKPGAFIIVGSVPINTPPSIPISGVVPIFSTATTVQPGSWASIYGTNLSAATNTWNGDFPTSLGGTSVTIDGKPAYLWIVSPTQINLQVPDDANVGPVTVTVTTPGGSGSATVNLGSYGPSFSLLNAKYPAAIVGTPGAPGTTSGGYDIIGPTGALPYPSRPVKAGETVLFYGVGFGPTTSPVPAGQVFSGAAPCVTLPQVTIGGVSATVSFAGIVEAGLYQLNVIVPNVGSGDQLLKATAGGVSTQSNLFLTVQ